jgi:hypothetical protein
MTSNNGIGRWAGLANGLGHLSRAFALGLMAPV